MEQTSSSITNKVNTLMAVCVVIVSILSCILMVVFKMNEDFFDSHGKIGNLAELEQQAYEQENDRLQVAKRNVSVSFVDKRERRMIIPLTQLMTEEEIEIKEDFLQNKIVITIKNGQQILREKKEVQIDSKQMEAIGVYRQKDNLVVEIFCKDIFICEAKIENQSMIFELWPVKEKYDRTLLVYIPYEQKNRLFSEEWIKEIRKLSDEKKTKIFLCSELVEPYSEKDVVDFANKLRADAVIGMEAYTEDANTRTFANVFCNPVFFIPEFGNVELACLFAEQIQKQFVLEAVPVMQDEMEQVLLQEARIPCVKAQFILQGNDRTIEEDYTFNHSLMETVMQMLSELYQ